NLKSLVACSPGFLITHSFGGVTPVIISTSSVVSDFMGCFLVPLEIESQSRAIVSRSDHAFSALMLLDWRRSQSRNHQRDVSTAQLVCRLVRWLSPILLIFRFHAVLAPWADFIVKFLDRKL